MGQVTDAWWTNKDKVLFEESCDLNGPRGSSEWRMALNKSIKINAMNNNLCGVVMF